MGEIKYVGALILFSVFVLAFVSYATNFATDNNAVVNVNDDEGFSGFSSKLESNITEFSVTEVGKSAEIFDESSLAPGDETAQSGQQFKTTVRSLARSMTTILALISANIFGGSPAFAVVTTALGGFLVFLALRYGYKTWVGRNPD